MAEAKLDVSPGSVPRSTIEGEGAVTVEVWAAAANEERTRSKRIAAQPI
jgi:hypothetical protein